MMRKVFLFSFLLSWTLAFRLLAQPSASLPELSWKTEQLSKGLAWKNVHTDQLYNSRQHINVLEINTRKHRLGIAYCVDTIICTSDLAVAAKAAAAVNAGFFDTKAGGSVTFLKVDGNVVNLTRPKHREEKSEILRGALILGPGERVQIRAAEADSVYFSKKYRTVLLTGPLLIENKQVVALADRPFNTNRHPRTCACITEDKRLLLLTVDGRTDQSHGMSLPELTTLLQSLGCRDAVNLDGGGSTTMWIAGKPESGIVNMPCDNKLFDAKGERRVANAVVVWE